MPLIHLESLSKPKKRRSDVPCIGDGFSLGELDRVIKVVSFPDRHALFVEPAGQAEYAADAEPGQLFH